MVKINLTISYNEALSGLFSETDFKRDSGKNNSQNTLTDRLIIYYCTG